MSDFPLFDLMRPPLPPIWRAGKALYGNVHTEHGGPQHGDLQWFADDYQDPRFGGKWFSYDGPDRIWVCVDPFNYYGINKVADRPPNIEGGGYSNKVLT